jgi:uncharacterized membrane protein
MNLILSILAAFALAGITIFEKIGAPYVNKVFGIILIQASALVFSGFALFTKTKGESLINSPKGITFMVLTGLSVFIFDFLVLKIYASGYPVTVAGPIITGGGVAIIAVIGFLMGEQINLTKIMAIVLIFIGTVMLSRY